MLMNVVLVAEFSLDKDETVKQTNLMFATVRFRNKIRFGIGTEEEDFLSFF